MCHTCVMSELPDLPLYEIMMCLTAETQEAAEIAFERMLDTLETIEGVHFEGGSCGISPDSEIGTP